MKLVFDILIGLLADDVLLSSDLHCTLSRVKREHGDVIFFCSQMDYLIRLLCNEYDLLSSDIRVIFTSTHNFVSCFGFLRNPISE